MNCPHCHRQWPEGYGGNSCPFCGGDISSLNALGANGRRINWLVFYVILLAPAALNLVGVMCNAGYLIFPSTFLGSLLAGIICGLMLARYRGMRGSLAFLLVMGLGVFSFILCFAGCIARGF